jgi:hypothetical protein
VFHVTDFVLHQNIKGKKKLEAQDQINEAHAAEFLFGR